MNQRRTFLQSLWFVVSAIGMTLIGAGLVILLPFYLCTLLVPDPWTWPVAIVVILVLFTLVLTVAEWKS